MVLVMDESVVTNEIIVTWIKWVVAVSVGSNLDGGEEADEVVMVLNPEQAP